MRPQDYRHSESLRQPVSFHFHLSRLFFRIKPRFLVCRFRSFEEKYGAKKPSAGWKEVTGKCGKDTTVGAAWRTKSTGGQRIFRTSHEYRREEVTAQVRGSLLVKPESLDGGAQLSPQARLQRPFLRFR
ncbi:hypothetical protein RvY_00571-2 [Ramazzottius varieornatus]|uniref:Uncharacterized protein n=1 Tax=Ramazzottius varieornatus TaxID=947166 RepID=A0A1D1UN51_RAMVA|nr:hypothetical protein RvY_00571-2 [Ramazzottius varieornatus]